jgi:D-alanine--poly(phosphoribitol) ligase subunit 2
LPGAPLAHRFLPPTVAMTSQAVLESQIADIVESIVFTKVAPETHLLESGLVDSVTTVELMLAIEARYHCTVPATEVAIHLESVRTLAAFIAAYSATR